MSYNATPPQAGQGAPGGTSPLANPQGTVNTPAPAPAAPNPDAGMPWEGLQRQLESLQANQQQLVGAVQTAAAAYNAIKDAPVQDPNSLDAQAGAVPASAKTQALNAYVAAQTKLQDAIEAQAKVAGDIATSKQQYATTHGKDPLYQAQADSATAQAGYYQAQAAEAKARTDYLASPEGKAKDQAAATLDQARAKTEGAQQALYATQQTLYSAQAANASAQASQTNAYVNAGGPGTEAAKNTAAANASNAQTDVSNEELRQKKLGDLGTLIDTMANLQKQGLIDQAGAEQIINTAKSTLATGATPYQWQQQADTNVRDVSQQFIQSGGMVRGDQQYVVGGEPGGALQQAVKGWGFDFTPTKLQPTSAPAYVQSLGLTSGQPQAGAVAQGTPAYAASLQALPDLSHMTPDQADAFLHQAAASAQSTTFAAQPQAAQPQAALRAR